MKIGNNLKEADLITLQNKKRQILDLKRQKNSFTKKKLDKTTPTLLI